MKLSIRHFAWAPLLIVAAVISYGLVEGMHEEPCASERHALVVGRLIAAAIALYLVAAYWLAVTRKYLAMAILTLWAWHLIMISPFLATKCSEQRSLDQLFQVTGVGLGEYITSIVIVAAASSFALFLRYRTVNGLPVPDQRTFLGLSVAGAAVVSLALTAGVYWIVPLLREAYSTLGTDLPSPTLVLLYTYQYWSILPLACVVGFLYVRTRDQFTVGQLQIALNGVVGLIILLNVASSAFLFSALAPVKTMCGCV